MLKNKREILIETFASRFFKKVNLEEYDGMLFVNMESNRFLEILEEEIDNFGKDTQAEVGMGIYKIIAERRKVISDSLILDMLINVCKGLINKSPECALEFSKQIEGKYA